MVHVETMQAQQAFYEARKAEILASGRRFAVLSASPTLLNYPENAPRFAGGSIEYFDSPRALYGKHPYFKPDAKPTGDTLPMLIDLSKLIEEKRILEGLGKRMRKR